MNEKSDIYMEGELLYLRVKKDNIVIPMNRIKEFEFISDYLVTYFGSIVIKELYYVDYCNQSQLIYRWVQQFGWFSKKIDCFLVSLEQATNKTIRIVDNTFTVIPQSWTLS